MKTRQKDKKFSRYIGPADRSKGEFKGERVEVVDYDYMRETFSVRFPDGTVGRVHDDHLTFPFFGVTA